FDQLSIIHIYIISYLFLYSYDDHRDLHSFPTRRSSDLIGSTFPPSCRFSSIRRNANTAIPSNNKPSTPILKKLPVSVSPLPRLFTANMTAKIDSDNNVIP